MKKILVLLLVVMSLVTFVSCDKDTSDTDDTVLVDKIAEAKSVIEDYVDLADYREAEKALVNTAIANAIAQIEAAKTVDEVNAALAAGKTALDAIKTAAELAAEETPTWKTAVLAPTENEGELLLKAEVSVGKVYYVLVKAGTAPTKEQIVAGVDYGTVTVVDAGNSGTTSLIEKTISELEKGVEYTAYIVGVKDDVYSSIQNKSAVTFRDVYKGLGTVEAPFEISTVADLEQVGLGVYEIGGGGDWTKTSHYILLNDIDLSEKYGEGKANWVPIALNSGGSFDGQNFTISGLYINVEIAESDCGLFSTINNGASVKNLVIKDVYISADGYYDTPRNSAGTNISGFSATGFYTGSLAGNLKGTADNVHVVNTTIVVKGGRAGGLVGRVYSDDATINGPATINNCSVVNGNITGATRLGGIVGLSDNKTGILAETPAAVINNVVFTGTLTGVDNPYYADGVEKETPDGYNYSEYIGGIGGWIRGAKISNAIAIADIEATRMAGGIVGFLQTQTGTPKLATEVNNVLFAGSVHITNNIATLGDKTTSATVIGQASTNTSGNGYVIGEKIFAVIGSTATFVNTGDRAESSRMGVEVAFSDLTTEWFTTNMEGFDWSKFTVVVADLELDPIPVVPAIETFEFNNTTTEAELSLEVVANVGKLYYVIVKEGAAPTKEQIIAGINYGDVVVVKAGNSLETSVIEVVFADLEAGVEYTIYLVLVDGETVSDIQTKKATTFKEGQTPVFNAATVTKTTNEGELSIVADGTNGKIYYIVVKEGAEPTKEQIVAGVNYGDVTVVAAGNSGDTLAVEVTLTDLLPDTEYTVYLVMVDGEKSSEIKFLSATTHIYKGAGTAADPFRVSTVTDLEKVTFGTYESYGNWGKGYNYILMNDIDLTEKYGEGKSSWNAGELNAGGSFNGAGFTIKGLYINTETTADTGLFKIIQQTATVKNLTLENVSITTPGLKDRPRTPTGTEVASTTADSAGYAGALAGTLRGVVDNVHVVNLKLVATYGRVGGLVGRIYTSTAVTDETGPATIKNSSVINAEIQGTARIGGIAGVTDSQTNNSAVAPSAIINNVVFSGKITGVDQEYYASTDPDTLAGMHYSEYMGGIVGWSRSTIITNVVVKAEISATRTAGGIIGYFQVNSNNPNTATEVNNALFSGTVQTTTTSGDLADNNNSGTIVALLSSGTVGEELFYVSGSEATFGYGETRNTKAKMGTEVAFAALTSEWFTNNLPGFDGSKFTFAIADLEIAVAE